jgi:hypothetical protein
MTMREEESGPEEEDDRWGRGASKRRREGQRTASGVGRGGPWAGSAAGPDSVPRPFTFFVLSFSFLGFYFFYIVRKTTPNEPKQNPLKFSKIQGIIS